ncbi:polyhydroxyalkanoate synthesis repressor PhaR [Woodsholea maritima]|uniref:polyhydroxyalkanoate synthesis repressor PhaR n=1 Tax=Woodsholea maritima TaxID=240237 RepID=UPI00036C438E|nr:polyhydroxyalkanoate synthesis repressor PhaR [Woodsholea maritima]
MSQTDPNAPIIIKKYANRRLYDTSASRYVTLDHLRELVKSNTDFKVVDAKSGDDLTRGVLAQIIFEEESKGANLLPVEFLRQLIGIYGDSMQAFVPDYLRLSMEGFMKQQEAIRAKMQDAMGSPRTAMALMEEQTKRNMAMFEQAMSMFSPFKGHEGTGQSGAPDASAQGGEDVAAMRAQLDAMQAKLDKLTKA